MLLKPTRTAAYRLHVRCCTVRFWNPSRAACVINACAAPGERRTPKRASIPGCCCDAHAAPGRVPVRGAVASVVTVPASGGAVDPSTWFEELPHPATRTAAQPPIAIVAIRRTGGQAIHGA